jgi:hypothetical protein
MNLDSSVWGPHYWFMLHTLTLTYPNTPNEVTKKKYYEFIQNLPLFIPDETMGNEFAEYLDKFPVTPYLDSRQSFMKWMHFIHNQVNIKLGKHIVDYDIALKSYYDNYLPKEIIKKEEFKYKKHLIYTLIVILLIILISLLYYIFNRTTF